MEEKPHSPIKITFDPNQLVRLQWEFPSPLRFLQIERAAREDRLELKKGQIGGKVTNGARDPGHGLQDPGPGDPGGTGQDPQNP